MIAKPAHGLHEQDALEGEQPGLDAPGEQRVATIISGCFMVLVGLSMPAVGGPEVAEETERSVSAVAGGSPGWGLIALHVLAVTLLSNLGSVRRLLAGPRREDTPRSNQVPRPPRRREPRLPGHLPVREGGL